MQRLLFVLTLILFCCSCKTDIRFIEQEPVYRLGDDLSWAATKVDNSSWDTLRGNTGNKVFWARQEVTVINRPADKLGLQIESFGAFEVYWDGTYIGNNGKPRTGEAKEVPGTESSYYSIPDSLATIGAHILALRITQSYQSNEQRSIGVKLASYKLLLQRPLIIMAFMNLMAGAFLVAGIYYLLLFFTSTVKRLAVLLFALVCLLFFALLIVEFMKFYIEIPYTKFYLRLEWIGWLTFAIAIFVPAYFALQFGFKYIRWLLAILFCTLVLVYILNYRHYDRTAMVYSFIMWSASVAIVLEALFRKQKGAGIVLAGLLLAVVVHQYLVYDFGLFISFSAVMLCMLYLHTLAMRALEQEHERSLLISSRLRLELLKKNIQPHFLKNTLTSLIDWVEESPKDGAKFIQALAGEFDIMNTISEQQLIPIAQEIALCRTHIEVMSFRKEIKYEWMDFGIDLQETIPPAIVHTLLENGITHSIPINNVVRFELHYNIQKGYKQYTFKTFGENRAIVRENNERHGMSYVRARLKESYGSKWHMDSNATLNGWSTNIKIYD